MSGPRPLSSILNVTPYVPGRDIAGGWKLASNENPLGCSPSAKDAIIEATQRTAIYPDGSAYELRRALGEKHNIDKDRIICGAGSDEIFQFIGRAYLEAGDEIIQTEHGFLVYEIVAQQSGATTIKAPETNLQANVDAILSCITPNTKIVFLANPNNPTGSYLPWNEVERLHNAIPEYVLLVLDEAYFEYVEQSDYKSGITLANSASNVLVTRTFSKAYGLASLRLGWAYGSHEIIDALHRTRGPFNLTSPAIAAGIAAIADEEFLSHSVQFNNSQLEKLKEALSTIGLTVYPSAGNFVLVDFEKSERAKLADNFLRENGISVRAMGAYGLPSCLRISIGLEEANQAVIKNLSEFTKSS